MDLQAALAGMATGHRGFSFLLAHGLGWLACGVVATVARQKIAALCVLFQACVTLPLSFLLDRILGFGGGQAGNPLLPLVIYLALAQSVAVPVVVIAYRRFPVYVPATMAAIVGAHFFPYAWVLQARIYLVLGVLVSWGSFALMALWREKGFVAVPYFVGSALLIAAAIVY